MKRIFTYSLLALALELCFAGIRRRQRDGFGILILRG